MLDLNSHGLPPGILPRGAKQLWQWVATDVQGNTRTYQAEAPDMPDEVMFAYLRGSFINVKFEDLKKIPPDQRKVATGVVQAHTFDHGIKRRLMREMGITDPAETQAVWRELVGQRIKRRPMVRAPLLQR